MVSCDGDQLCAQPRKARLECAFEKDAELENKLAKAKVTRGKAVMLYLAPEAAPLELRSYRFGVV